MKKLVLSAAALMLATAFSFAGTPETKTEAKPEVKTEAKSTLVYHFVSKSGNQITFAAGEPSSCPNPGTTPCRWESETPLTSPMSQDDIEDQTLVTDYRQ